MWWNTYNRKVPTSHTIFLFSVNSPDVLPCSQLILSLWQRSIHRLHSSLVITANFCSNCKKSPDIVTSLKVILSIMVLC